LERVESLEEEHVCAERNHGRSGQTGQVVAEGWLAATGSGIAASDPVGPTARPVSPPHRD
jgi:hypothetical protein